MGFMKIFIAPILSLFFFNSLHTYEYAKYDPICDCMCVERCIGIHNDLIHPIPKIIHQIWFGDKSRKPKEVEEWTLYSEFHNYQYHFWDEQEINLIKPYISPKNWEMIEFFIHYKNFWCASDMVRCELLRIYGGIYIDCDFHIPNVNGISIDLERILNLQGSFFITENHSPNIGEGALFVCNGFMGTCKNHPIMQSMCHQFIGNIVKFHYIQNCYDARYITGPFLLNKVMNGSFQVIPIKLSVELGIWN